MEPKTWTGHWWLPNAPEHTVEGTLTFSEDRLALVLTAPLVAVSMEAGQVFHDLWEPTSHTLILGTVDNGRPATLVNASGNAVLIPFAIASETWAVQLGFIGIDLDSPDQPAFARALVTVDHLDTWLGDRTPTLQVQYGEAGELLKVAASAERQVVHEAATPWGTVAAISNLRLDVKGPSASLTILNRLQVTSDEPVSWDAIWVDRVIPLQQLLVISLGRGCPIHEMQLTSPGVEAPITALFRTPDDGRERPLRRITPLDFVLTAENMPGGFEKAIIRWYDLAAKHRVAVRELFDTLRAPERFASDQMVSLVRVIGPLVDEAQKVAAGDQADQEFAEFLDKVAAAISDNALREAVLGKLDSSGVNDRQRLTAIASDLGVVSEYLCGGDIGKFAQRVVASRHKTAHPSSQPPKHALDGDLLIAHLRALEWLLRCALLARLGMPLDEMLQRIQDCGATAVPTDGQ